MTDDLGAPGTVQEPFRLSPWRADNTAALVAAGATEEAALAAALNGILAATQGERPEPAARLGRSVSVQADAASLAALVPALAAALLDLLDGNPEPLAEVTIDGLLRTDEGLTAWGVAAVAHGTDTSPVTIALVGEPAVAETADGLTITATLRRGTE